MVEESCYEKYKESKKLYRNEMQKGSSKQRKEKMIQL